MNSSLDLARLEKVKHGGSRTSARCPACAASGGDKTGNNLSIRNSDGAFTCGVHPGEAGREHRREIFRLVGIRGERDPAQEREWRKSRVKMATEQHAVRKVSAALRAKRAHIVSLYPWTAAEARAESPEQRLAWLNDPRRFLAALFDQDALVWTGKLYDSGQDGRHASRWKSVSDWQLEPEHTVGPMVSPCTWKPGTVSRSADAVEVKPYTVLDFDGFDGSKPETPEEIRDHLRATMALVRWLREALGWNLAALLHTGNKSLHAWFHRPSPDALQSLRHTADALGVDPGLIDHPEHPCRLPGWLHAKTGKSARVLWLKSLT